MKNKNILLSYSVAYASYNLLNMEKNGLVERNKSSADKDFDIPKDEIVELAKAIKQLENTVMFILRRIKLSKEDIAYVEKKDTQIMEAFFKTNILASGVSPHLLFTCVLYSYFMETKNVSISPHFKQLTQQELYDNIFLKIEESEIVNWKEHMDVTSKILLGGLGVVY